jgi:uncharacterized protein
VIERVNEPLAAKRIAATARRLLEASALCAIATVSTDGRAHVNTAYFAWNQEFELVWLSHPQAGHSRNVRANGSVAVAVYDSTQTWGRPDRGIQLFGSAHEREADGGDAEGIYAARFPEYVADDFRSYRFYLFQPMRLKVFDEPALGPGVFVTAKVGSRGRLAWEQTEIYGNTPPTPRPKRPG